MDLQTLNKKKDGLIEKLFIERKKLESKGQFANATVLSLKISEIQAVGGIMERVILGYNQILDEQTNSSVVDKFEFNRLVDELQNVIVRIKSDVAELVEKEKKTDKTQRERAKEELKTSNKTATNAELINDVLDEVKDTADELEQGLRKDAFADPRGTLETVVKVDKEREKEIDAKKAARNNMSLGVFPNLGHKGSVRKYYRKHWLNYCAHIH